MWKRQSGDFGFAFDSRPLPSHLHITTCAMPSLQRVTECIKNLTISANSTVNALERSEQRWGQESYEGPLIIGTIHLISCTSSLFRVARRRFSHDSDAALFCSLLFATQLLIITLYRIHSHIRLRFSTRRYLRDHSLTFHDTRCLNIITPTHSAHHDLHRSIT